MKPLKRKSLPLYAIGVRKKMRSRRSLRSAAFDLPAYKPNAGEVHIKEEKIVIETKEEKFNSGELTTKKLKDIITTLTTAQLNEIVKSDERVTAVKIAKEELLKRGN